MLLVSRIPIALWTWQTKVDVHRPRRIGPMLTGRDVAADFRSALLAATMLVPSEDTGPRLVAVHFWVSPSSLRS